MHHIRPYRETDNAHLADLYEETVRRLAPVLYSPEQVEAWAMAARDSEHFHAMLTNGQTFVAVDSLNSPIGFAGVEPSGRVASLYVAADSTRKGIGSSLLQHIIQHATKGRLPLLWSEASFLSRVVFERHNFAVENAEHVMFNGVKFKRWIMRQRLDTDDLRSPKR